MSCKCISYAIKTYKHSYYEEFSSEFNVIAMLLLWGYKLEASLEAVALHLK